MKLGILGGTFSPVHNGHIRLAQTYRQALGLDPGAADPHPHPRPTRLPRTFRTGSTAAVWRSSPARRCRALPSPTSSSAARARATPSTPLEELHRLYPEAELYLLMGSDMFRTVLTWHRGRGPDPSGHGLYDGARDGYPFGAGDPGREDPPIRGRGLCDPRRPAGCLLLRDSGGHSRRRAGSRNPWAQSPGALLHPPEQPLRHR